MANFEPVRTKADLESLDQAEIFEGYCSAERGDPEPGPNRGRSYWHGWRNRMIDMGQLPVDEAAMQLVREVYPRLNKSVRSKQEKSHEHLPTYRN